MNAPTSALSTFTAALAVVLIAASCSGSSHSDTAAPDADTPACANCADSGPAPLLPDDQGWDDAERELMHSISLGGQFIPFSWYLALENGDGESYMDSAVLQSFGMSANPDDSLGLPVGFGKTLDEDGDEHVGFNCFACHTGEVRANGASRLIYGGGTQADFFGYTEAIMRSLSATLLSPSRFSRFAGEVLGSGDNLFARTALYTRVEIAAATFAATNLIASATVDVEEGFGRVDANGRTAALLSLYLNPTGYPDAIDAPVGYPSLWNTPRFDWDHYGAGVQSHLARNVSQAMANFAPFNPITGESEIPLENIERVHQGLMKLRAPRWPVDLLGELEQARVSRGADLYAQECESCHGIAEQEGEIYLQTFDVDEADTDPNYLLNARDITINATALGLDFDTPLHEFLQHTTEQVMEYRFDQMGATAEEREQYSHGRANQWRGPVGYKAIPLDGIWATAPYLHNHSVPTLHDLLLPASERPGQFRVDPTADYDAERGGIGASEAGFLFDTTISGNSNVGHEYGTLLSDAERSDLLEYLKSI